jgi:hypothetical protein
MAGLGGEQIINERGPALPGLSRRIERERAKAASPLIAGFPKSVCEIVKKHAGKLGFNPTDFGA